jgi:hypothetical protein
VTRAGEDEYEVRIIQKDSPAYKTLSPYAINFIGHQGKRYGVIDNDQFAAIVGVNIPDRSVDNFDVVDVNPSGPTEDE